MSYNYKLNENYVYVLYFTYKFNLKYKQIFKMLLTMTISRKKTKMKHLSE